MKIRRAAQAVLAILIGGSIAIPRSPSLAVATETPPLVFTVAGFERSYAVGDTIRLRWQIHNPGRLERTVLAPIEPMRNIGAVNVMFGIRRADGSVIQVRSESYRSMDPRREEYVPVTLPPGGRVSGSFELSSRWYPGWMLPVDGSDSPVGSLWTGFNHDRVFPKPGSYEVMVTSRVVYFAPTDSGGISPPWAGGVLEAGPYTLRIREP